MTRGYDDAGRLSSVGDWLGHTTRFGYDPDSQLTSQAYPNGVSATQAFDNADRLTSISDASSAAGQFLNLPYGRDPAGQLSSEGPKTFAYDQNNRVKAQSAAPAVSYGYDTADNPTSATVTGGPSKTMSYDAAHQLTAMTTTGSPTATYAYDQNGNRTSDGITPGACGYDQANRLTGYLSSVGSGEAADRMAATSARPSEPLVQFSRKRLSPGIALLAVVALHARNQLQEVDEAQLPVEPPLWQVTPSGVSPVLVLVVARPAPASRHLEQLADGQHAQRFAVKQPVRVARGGANGPPPIPGVLG